MAHLVPIVVGGYRPPEVPSNPRLTQLTALDDLFARHPVLTLVHIVPGMLFPCNWFDAANFSEPHSGSALCCI